MSDVYLPSFIHAINTVVTPGGQLQSIPRRLLDPRRHQNKPSAADGEEQLIPYEPVLPDDHRRVLSRDFDVGFNFMHVSRRFDVLNLSRLLGFAIWSLLQHFSNQPRWCSPTDKISSSLKWHHLGGSIC